MVVGKRDLPSNRPGIVTPTALGQTSMTEYDTDVQEYSGEHPWRDEDVLRELYVEKQLPAKTVADRLGCSDNTVYKWLRERGIEVRKMQDSMHNRAPSELKDPEVLQHLYAERNLTCEQIAERVGRGASSVHRWLVRHEIERRDSQYAEEIGEKEKEEMERLYVESGLSMHNVGDELGYSGSAVMECLDERDVDSRSRGLRGEKHPQWSVGKETVRAVRRLIGPQSWYATRKSEIERSGGGCEMCGQKPENQTIDIHHIVPLSAGGCNAPELLMSLCRSCHRRAESYTEGLFEPVLID
jgi:transposase